ncbi:MAG: prolyl oligopeptidase family serine peptidase, partial [Pseudomonadota bacterium]
VMVLHGDKDVSNTIAASERMAKELQQHGIETEYAVVPNGEHLNAFMLYAPQIFDFLDKH